MASEIYIFRLFKAKSQKKADVYFLLRATQRPFSNVDQNAQEKAQQHAEEQCDTLLKKIIKQENLIENFVELIGEMQGYPVGDELLIPQTKRQLNIFYVESEFGHPWIILGIAKSEENFIKEIEDDEDLISLKPKKEVKKLAINYFVS